MRIDLEYKNFDLSVFGSGIAGREGFDNYTFFNNFIRGRENVGPGVFGAWTAQNPSSRIPALSLTDNNGEARTSNYFILNTSYFKLRNVQLGYSLNPKSVFTRLRFFAMGDNLFWLKDKLFLGPDPERTDINAIPVPRSFTFGVNASF